MKKQNIALTVLALISGVWLIGVSGGNWVYLGWISVIVSIFALVVGLLAHKKQKELPNIN